MNMLALFAGGGEKRKFLDCISNRRARTVKE
jgi:hypothetical protein